MKPAMFNLYRLEYEKYFKYFFEKQAQTDFIFYPYILDNMYANSLVLRSICDMHGQVSPRFWRNRYESRAVRRDNQ